MNRMENTYQFDFTHEEVSYLLELLHNEQYTGNTKTTLHTTRRDGSHA